VCISTSVRAGVVDDYGFALQNRGALFELDAKHPNVIAPRKRPYQTIIRRSMEKGDIHMGFGIMGGMNQTPAHAQFVSNVVDHGNEHPDGARSTALHETEVLRVRPS